MSTTIRVRITGPLGPLDFLGNISTVLSLRLQAVSRRIVAARFVAMLEPARKAIRVNEQKWCAVDRSRPTGARSPLAA